MKKAASVRTVCVVALLMRCSLAGAQYMPPSRPLPVPLPQPQTEAKVKGRLAEVPVDKRYSELTQEQKNKFKAQYQSMSDDDEPPFPIDGLTGLYKPIADAQQLLRLEGPLEMEVEVDATGKAKSVSVRKSPSTEMTKVAAAALMFHAYKPAVCRGTPCAMVFPLQVDFTRR